MKKKMALALCSLMIFGSTAAALPAASAVTVNPQVKVVSTLKKAVKKTKPTKTKSAKKTVKAKKSSKKK